MLPKIDRLRLEFPKIIDVIKQYHGKVNPKLEVPLEEYQRRQNAVNQELSDQGFSAGIVTVSC